MILNIEKFAESVKSESRMLADLAVASLRQATLETAGFVAKSKAPIKVVADTSLKLNNASHKTIEKLLKAQANAFEDLVDGSSRRLEMAARAKTFKGLFEEQVAALPAARDTAIGNARKTVEIVRSSGDQLSGIVRGALEEKPAKKAPARRKATSKRTTTRKTSAKKSGGARKTSARKAPSRKKAASKAKAA